MPLNVIVQLIPMIPMKLSVHLAQTLVNLVIWMVTVLNVKPTELVYLIVLVSLTISKIKSKELFSVKYVMSDVLNVTTFSIYVKVVLLTLKELTLQNVTVLKDS